jgi:hypothetical protein
LFLVQLYRWFPSVLQAITIIRPETLVRWHRAGFSRSLGGRPKIAVLLPIQQIAKVVAGGIDLHVVPAGERQSHSHQHARAGRTTADGA